MPTTTRHLTARLALITLTSLGALTTACGDDPPPRAPLLIIVDEDMGASADMPATPQDMSQIADMSQRADMGDPVDMNDPPDMGALCTPITLAGATLAGTERARSWTVTADDPGRGLQALFGVYTDPPAAGTYTFDGKGLDACEVCLVLYTGCDDTSCARTYMPVSGTATVTRQGAQLGVTLANLSLAEVTIGDALATTFYPDARRACLPQDTLSVTLATDPCDGMPDPQLVDKNCGPAPLTVTFDGSGILSNFERVDDYFWSFGDGTTSREARVTHTYATPGEYRAEFKASGRISDFNTTITTPSQIRAY